MTEILLRRSSQTGHYPTTSTLALGELAINTFDGRLFFVKNNGTPSLVEILTSSSSGGGYLPTPTPITPGSSAKVTYNQYGLITSGGVLVASDIPSLDWSIITTGKPSNLAGYGITDAANLISNTFTGPQTILGNSLRLSGWSGQATDGLLYFGSGDNYVYKSGPQFVFNISGGLNAILNSSGTIFTSGSPQTIAATKSNIDNSTNIATTAFVQNVVAGAISSLSTSNAVVKIMRGHYCFFAQTANNKIYSWGYNNTGQLGSGDTNNDLSREIQFPTYLNVFSILDFTVCGSTAYVLFSNNELYGWGGNAYGQLGLGTALAGTNILLPTKLLAGVSKMFYCQNGHDWEYQACYVSMIVQKTDNSFWCAGSNGSGELGLGSIGTPVTVNQNSWVAMVPPTGKTISKVWVGSYVYKNTFIQTTDYAIYAAGDNSTGSFGIGNTTGTSVWTNVSFFNAYNTASNCVVDIKNGGNPYDGTTLSSQAFTVVLTANGLIFTAGYNDGGQLGNGTSSGTTPNSAFNQVTLGGVGTKVAVQTIQTYDGVWAIFNDGTYARWGYNANGALGNGTVVNIFTPLMSASTDPGGAVVTNIFAPAQEWGWAYQKFVWLLKPTGLYFCGYNAAGIAGLGSGTVNTNVTTMTQVPVNNLNISNITTTANYNSGTPSNAALMSFTGSNTLYGSGWGGANNYVLNSAVTTAKYCWTHINAIPGTTGAI